jgi:hypothetical protein
MKNATLHLLGAVILITFPSIAAQAQTEQSVRLSAGSTILVRLQKWVDARKNKVGDEVVAKTTEHVKSDEQVALPRGSKIIGRVTAVKARTKEEPESAIGIVFEHAVLKDGRELHLDLTIQAIAPAETSASQIMSMTPATAGGMTGGTAPISMGSRSDPNAGTPGRINTTNDFSSGSENGLSSRGELTPTCQGVLGIDGLYLNPDNSTQGSVIVSPSRNVHLDFGTQMMLRVKAKQSP